MLTYNVTCHNILIQANNIMFVPFSENGKCFYPLNARTSMNADDDMKWIMYTHMKKI